MKTDEEIRLESCRVLSIETRPAYHSVFCICVLKKLVGLGEKEVTRIPCENTTRYVFMCKCEVLCLTIFLSQCFTCAKESLVFRAYFFLKICWLFCEKIAFASETEKGGL